MKSQAQYFGTTFPSACLMSSLTDVDMMFGNSALYSALGIGHHALSQSSHQKFYYLTLTAHPLL